MERRQFLQTSGLTLGSLLIGKSILTVNSGTNVGILSYPDKITALLAGKEVKLLKNGTRKWGTDNLAVSLINTNSSIEVLFNAPKTALLQITLVWNAGSKLSSTILNGHWERTYGDVSWHKPATSSGQ